MHRIVVQLFHCRCLHPVSYFQYAIYIWLGLCTVQGWDLSVSYFFRAVSTTDMIWHSRYSQQPSAGRTVDTVPSSCVIPFFRGSPKGNWKMCNVLFIDALKRKCIFPKSRSFRMCIFLSSLVVNRLCESVRALSNSCHNVDILSR